MLQHQFRYIFIFFFHCAPILLVCCVYVLSCKRRTSSTDLVFILYLKCPYISLLFSSSLLVLFFEKNYKLPLFAASVESVCSCLRSERAMTKLLLYILIHSSIHPSILPLPPPTPLLPCTPSLSIHPSHSAACYIGYVVYYQVDLEEGQYIFLWMLLFCALASPFILLYWAKVQSSYTKTKCTQFHLYPAIPCLKNN